MANVSDIMTSNYNLTKVFSTDVFDNPTGWFAGLNNELSGYVITGILVFIGVVMFVYMKENKGLKDSEAGLFSGVIISIVGLLLFVASTGTSVKLLSWEQYMLFLVITASLIIVNFIGRRY